MMNQELDLCGLFDSHAHYFDKKFEAEGGADAFLRDEVFGKGVAAVVNVATNPENAKRCIEQAKNYSAMYTALGIHPEDAQHLTVSIDEALSELCALMDTSEKRKAGKIVALGEIGLDYYWQPYDKELQIKLFEKQLDLAEAWDLPVLIHDREAHGDCFETVLRHPNARGVFHSFSGSAEMARELVRRGWYISFSGVLTFKNARKVREVASVLPHDRILLETDAPYLSPEPFRGKINHSGRMAQTALALSEILGISYAETVLLTAENARRLFALT